MLAGLFVYFFSAANFTLSAEQGPQALCDQATQTADIDENGRITCKIKNPSPTHLVNIDNFGTLLVNVISLLLKFAGAIAVLLRWLCAAVLFAIPIVFQPELRRALEQMGQRGLWQRRFAGLEKEDIIKQGLPLPVQDYVPVSKEEKIIAHVDNLVFGSEEKTFQDVLDRFAKELGEDYVRRAKELKREIESF